MGAGAGEHIQGAGQVTGNRLLNGARTGIECLLISFFSNPDILHSILPPPPPSSSTTDLRPPPPFFPPPPPPSSNPSLYVSSSGVARRPAARPAALRARGEHSDQQFVQPPRLLLISVSAILSPVAATSSIYSHRVQQLRSPPPAGASCNIQSPLTSSSKNRRLHLAEE
ncbi:hypothetical protein PIB30_058525 [Stylosanthes scabra]|uniref:Uncharacterized protein n=1 Tax=Stylosanthes scabra TaxID=79078 RepID=A0ABU6ZIR1_9FABA|nr:hypothetical protein [Stylosanthes scabra]